MKTNELKITKHRGTGHLILAVVFWLFAATSPISSHAKIFGDINGDQYVDLKDAVQGLNLMVDNIQTKFRIDADVNGDGRIGVEEILYTLYTASGQRSELADLSFSASGNYSHDPGDGKLVLDIKQSDFPETMGLPIGVSTLNMSRIDSATIVVEFPPEITLTQTDGAPGDIVGSWKMLESRGCDELEMAFMEDGSLSIQHHSLGGLNFVGFDFHSSPQTSNPRLEVSREPEEVHQISIDLSGPDGVYDGIELQYDSQDMGWEKDPFSLPVYPTGGLWWISKTEIIYVDGSRAVYASDTPFNAYQFTTHAPFGVVRTEGVHHDRFPAQDYATKQGDEYFYIETFPNGSTKDNRTDPIMRIYREDDLVHWIAYNDDGGRSHLASGIKMPMNSGEIYYICVEDYYANGGFYSIKVSAVGFDGASIGTAAIPDKFEPDDDPDQAGVLSLIFKRFFMSSMSIKKLIPILIIGIFFFTAGPSSVTKSDLIHAVVENARKQTRITKRYDPSYVNIGYPLGDVPMDRGVCTDVVIRALRAVDVDLQALIHRDMKRHFSRYPRKWGLNRPDSNIDHRRVPNIRRYFERTGKALEVTANGSDYLPGDIVSWKIPGNLDHIGIIVDVPVRGTDRHAVVHNIGRGAEIEDVLFAFKITGHYRYVR